MTGSKAGRCLVLCAAIDIKYQHSRQSRNGYFPSLNAPTAPAAGHATADQALPQSSSNPLLFLKLDVRCFHLFTRSRINRSPECPPVSPGTLPPLSQLTAPLLLHYQLSPPSTPKPPSPFTSHKSPSRSPFLLSLLSPPSAFPPQLLH